MANHHTALSMFRTYASIPMNSEGLLASLLRQHLDDKDYDVNAIRAANFSKQLNFGRAASSLLMRGLSGAHLQGGEMGLIARLALSSPDEVSVDNIETYDGSAEQDRLITRTLSLLSGSIFIGEGAASRFVIESVVEGAVSKVPIAIIGQGAAGILCWTALRRAGFVNVRVFEKRGALGIWGQPNVAGGTKNNPRAVVFDGIAELTAAAGDGTKDGKSIPSFLTTVLNVHGDPVEGKKHVVRGVEVEDLNHEVQFDGPDNRKDTARFPIVVNCMGWGEPRDLSDSSRMTFTGERPVAVRWQQQLTRADVEGKKFALVGLGNSTAEMMTQIHAFQREGVECEYCVLTHYPRDAVQNPFDAVQHKNKTYRVFRDVSKPELTAFQGDLMQSRRDYAQALADDRIVSDVQGWTFRDGKIGIKHRSSVSSGFSREHRIDKLHVLTGYKHSEATFRHYGIDADDDGQAEADFDGEFRDSGGERSKGYFGMGAVLNAEHRKNAVVMPGMAFMIPDMVFGIAMRAAQHAHKQR